MDDLKFEAQYLPHITQQIGTGSLILFTGAGFSLDGFNVQNKNIPGAQTLTEMIWDIVYPGKEYEKGNDLKDLFDNALKHKRTALEKLLHSEFTAADHGQPDWYSKCLSLPWFRAYTLNVDNLMEVISERSQPNGRNITPISATIESLEKLNSSNLNVIHINGNLNHSIDNIIFSRSQYTNKNNTDYYDLLKNDLTQRPAIFIGSSLEEDSFWEHVISRGSKGERSNKEHRPRSYLVIPSLPTSKQTLLEEYNIEWLPMTGGEFIERIYDAVEPRIQDGFNEIKMRATPAGDHRQNFSFVPDLIENTNTDTDYLMGAEPTWDDVINNRVAERTCFHGLLKLANIILSSTEINRFITITGTAGTGKSSALKWLGVKLNRQGIRAAWLDDEYVYPSREFKNSLDNNNDINVILIDNSDLYENVLSELIHYALSSEKRILVVVELRSSKVDKCINQYKLTSKFTSDEFLIPKLTNDDIDILLQTLDRENRLGILKGATENERVKAFKKNANRQLLVAMYQATSGNKFEDRATHELNGLDGESKYIYGLVSFVTYYRYPITRDEVLLAIQDPDNTILNKLDKLHSRGMIHKAASKGERYRARHREIAKMICSELATSGLAYGILVGLYRIGVAKVSKHSSRLTREAKMLRHFCNHNFLDRLIGPKKARQLYSEFEYGLSWDSHYWLHRGALELEQDNLSTAQNFLDQAGSLRPDDPFILTEQAYLRFKKALLDPSSTNSFTLVDEAIEILLEVINNNASRPQPCDILCRQGLKWVEKANLTRDKKTNLLELFQDKIKTILYYEPDDRQLATLDKSIRKSFLSLAIPDNK
ncbi:MAG: hypothetical protein HFP81_04675 [Methylococcales symbiont of Hymedesmia sp. n. MRB-2018]|nr:MAG: hypothetical protein HFP81_04675 [Methylococcales symbiont of Hymedesmia sp. n. MRB-2018]